MRRSVVDGRPPWDAGSLPCAEPGLPIELTDQIELIDQIELTDQIELIDLTRIDFSAPGLRIIEPATTFAPVDITAKQVPLAAR